MPDDPPMPPMAPADFTAKLGRIDETASSFTRLLAALGDDSKGKRRTVQRWAAGERDIPGPIAALVNLLVALHERHDITTAALRQSLGAPAKAGVVRRGSARAAGGARNVGR